ncbi:hypothetical protein J2W30_005882 [Variovorax boronicumulans]|uniref:hypothetical protein n=1 Tax=Variovorax TaxID=34072 RepID=UPI00277E083B|nr:MULTISPECIES: hypothetical protein [Variovorax]MDQ0038095.1 hypothetical protein [Variovorax boronicumulans]MDQ0606242.1 hypothetical protein [Variovorax sp. W1I1]
MPTGDFLQFSVLPFGSFLIPVTAAVLWRLRKNLTGKVMFFVCMIGVLGGALVVAALRAFLLLPLHIGCLDCGLLNRWWYWDAITFVQGFGITSALALLAQRLALRFRR